MIRRKSSPDSHIFEKAKNLPHLDRFAGLQGLFARLGTRLWRNCSASNNTLSVTLSFESSFCEPCATTPLHCVAVALCCGSPRGPCLGRCAGARCAAQRAQCRHHALRNCASESGVVAGRCKCYADVFGWGRKEARKNHVGLGAAPRCC